MKKLQLTLFIGLVLSIASCKKENNGSKEIYGSWKLTATRNDPGGGNSVYIKVSENKYATFDTDGNIKGDAMPELISYKILDSVRMEVKSKIYADPLIYRYKITSNALELNPPCIEFCGLRFVRK